jgi:hypothetical protein
MSTVAPGIPQNFWVQQGNGQVFLSWNLVAGSTAYQVQRSSDGGKTFSNLAAPTLNQYLDTTALIGGQYYYQVASLNGATSSPFTTAQGIVPVLGGQTSLGALRLHSQQKADRVNSPFVTLPEWNYWINLAAYELYDLLITSFEEYYVAQPAYFTTNGTTYQFPLPDGALTFQNQAMQNYVAPPFYKLLGVDLGLNNAPNGFVTVKRFQFIDRNMYVFPNTASTIYGVFNLQYRILGNTIEFIPIPSAAQPIRIWYIPRLPVLLQDTDILDGVSGWEQYIIVRAAKYALDKEESPTEMLDQELLFLKTRIEQSATNRDVGQPDTISDTRYRTGFGGMAGGNFGGFGGGPGGW